MPRKPATHRPAASGLRHGADRSTAAQRGYGAAWQHARAVFLAAHPICECQECKQQGRCLPATVVDHVVPHRGNAALFWDESNWQALSTRCHDRKTATKDGGFGRPRSI